MLVKDAKAFGNVSTGNSKMPGPYPDPRTPEQIEDDLNDIVCEVCHWLYDMRDYLVDRIDYEDICKSCQRKIYGA